MRIVAVSVFSWAVVAGCFPDSTWECDQDTECSGGEVCARTHECLVASEVRALRVHWTIQGQTDLVAACPASSIDHRAVAFSATEADELAFSPVPCTGFFPIDKLPARMTQVDVRGQAADDRALFYGYATIAGDLDVTMDLGPAY